MHPYVLHAWDLHWLQLWFATVCHRMEYGGKLYIHTYMYEFHAYIHGKKNLFISFKL